MHLDNDMTNTQELQPFAYFSLKLSLDGSTVKSHVIYDDVKATVSSKLIVNNVCKHLGFTDEKLFDLFSLFNTQNLQIVGAITGNVATDLFKQREIIFASWIFNAESNRKFVDQHDSLKKYLQAENAFFHSLAFDICDIPWTNRVGFANCVIWFGEICLSGGDLVKINQNSKLPMLSSYHFKQPVTRNVYVTTDGIHFVDHDSSNNNNNTSLIITWRDIQYWKIASSSNMDSCCNMKTRISPSCKCDNSDNNKQCDVIFWCQNNQVYALSHDTQGALLKQLSRGWIHAIVKSAGLYFYSDMIIRNEDLMTEVWCSPFYSDTH